MFITRIIQAGNFFTVRKLKTFCYTFQNCFSIEKFQFQSENRIKILSIITKQKCSFHTSAKRDVPPIFTLIIRPLIRVTALLLGRTFRKWYEKKSFKEREEIWKWFIENRKFFLSCMGLYFSSVALYYITHLNYDPLTKRFQFILLNKKQQEKLGELTFQAHIQQFKPMLLPKTDPIYSKLLRITAKLINANRDLPNLKDKKWTLTVIDSSLTNAYVLPGGNIFVFLGTLQMVENDDQLAIILAHEIAHAILNHSYEQVSRGILMELLLALPIAFIWAAFPDLQAGFLLVLGQTIIDIFNTLPYSRALENEADTIGLFLAAKACIDIREAVVFWATMRILVDLKLQPNKISWLSTHPDHGDREKRMNILIAQAIRFRTKAGCSELSEADPRKKFYQRSYEEHINRLKQRSIFQS